MCEIYWEKTNTVSAKFLGGGNLQSEKQVSEKHEFRRDVKSYSTDITVFCQNITTNQDVFGCSEISMLFLNMWNMKKRIIWTEKLPGAEKFK